MITINRDFNPLARVEPEALRGTSFNSEQGAHTFVIRRMENGTENPFPAGTGVTGKFLSASGGSYDLSGTLTDGRATLTLIPACYSVTGRFLLTIMATSGDDHTVIYAAVGSVTDTTGTGSVVPGGTVPGYADLISDMNAVRATIPDDYSEMADKVAALDDMYSALVDTGFQSVVHFTAYKAEPCKLRIDLEPVQAGSGAPSPENVRPITGWDTFDLIHSPTTDAADGTTQTIDIRNPENPLTLYGAQVTIEQDGSASRRLTYYQVTNRGASNWTVAATAEDRVLGTSNLGDAYRCKWNEMLCSVLQPVNPAIVWTERPLYSVTINDGKLQVVLPPEYSDNARIKAFLNDPDGSGNPAQFTFKAQPAGSVFAISAQPVTALEGDNYIWVPNGLTAVRYANSLKPSFQALADSIAPAEEPVAGSAHDKGELFMLGNVLFRATSAIPAGDPVTEGVNAERISMAEAVRPKEISILFIGNSLTQDGIAYLPWLLKQLHPELRFRLGIWYNGGHTLAQHYDKMVNNTAAQTWSFAENTIAWTNASNTETLLNVLQTKTFDIVCMQEYFNYKTDYTSLTDWNNCRDYILDNYAGGNPLEFICLFHAPLRASADAVFDLTKTGNAKILQEGCADDMIPMGIAVYRALSTELDSLGTQGHLSPDGTHTQEGLPCLLQTWSVYLWLMDRLGLPRNALTNSAALRMSTDTQATINVPGGNGSVISGTAAMNRLAQLVAIQAYKEGKRFVAEWCGKDGETE